jgi:hypothetical protein
LNSRRKAIILGIIGIVRKNILVVNKVGEVFNPNFRYFINVNMMRILFNYPVQTKDAGISQDIDSIFSKKIKEIQLRISEVVKGHLRIKANYNEFADCFMDDSNTVAWFIGHLIKIFTIMNMEKEITDVIQCLLRFSKGLLPLKDILYELRWNHDIILKVPI